jgi:hypothetical protein
VRCRWRDFELRIPDLGPERGSVDRGIN